MMVALPELFDLRALSPSAAAIKAGLIKKLFAVPIVLNIVVLPLFADHQDLITLKSSIDEPSPTSNFVQASKKQNPTSLFILTPGLKISSSTVTS